MSAPRLAELEGAFVRYVRGEGGEAVLAQVCGAGLAPAARLGIYRNNLLLNLTDALRTCYPAAERLVGEEFFAAAAQRYVRAHPSGSGNLQDYGAAFPDFLAAMPEADAVAYLGDVARLERARQEALLAPDAEPFDASAFAEVDPADYPRRHLRLHPSARLLASRFPVYTLWSYCRQEAPGDPPDAGAGGERVLVVRPRDAVLTVPLPGGEYAFLRACGDGATLGEALAQAEAAQAGFELAACVARHHEAGVFAA